MVNEENLKAYLRRIVSVLSSRVNTLTDISWEDLKEAEVWELTSKIRGATDLADEIIDKKLVDGTIKGKEEQAEEETGTEAEGI